MQHVAIDRVQGARLVQIHDPLVAGLRPGPARVVVAFADRHPPAAVGNVVQLQAQHLAWPQPAVEHQQEHRKVPQARQTGQQRVDVLAAHRSGQPQRESDPHRAAYRLLPARCADERLVPIRHPSQRVIDPRCIGLSPTVYCSAAIAQSKKLDVAASTRCTVAGRQQPALLGRDRQPEPLRRAP